MGMDVSAADSAFKDLCDSASDLIQSVSPETGSFLYVNAAWLRTLGYAAEDLPKLNVFDVIHPGSRAHCRAVMARLVAGDSAQEVAVDLQARDGSAIAVEGSVACRFAAGRPVATVGIFRDVRRRKHAEEELDRLFWLSLDMLCIAGVDGFFKRVNPAFEKTLGYTREELLSRQFIEFVHPDDRPDTLAQLRNLEQGLAVVNFRNRYRAKDGVYRWLDWHSAPPADDGLIYAVARDVTDQRRAEEELARRTAELARSNAELEQFAYVASHDLGSPLRNVATIAEWLEEEIGVAPREEVQKHLQLLRDRVRRMERLTDDLLEYSRAGKTSGAATTVDTAALVHEVAAFLAPPDGFQVLVRGEMPVLRTERTPLEQVFRNLIGNAIKHHDRTDGLVEVSSREEGGSPEFLVQDDGPGVPEPLQDRAFQMLQRFGAPGRAEGFGIGLALVKRLVESRGGRILLESSGRGTCLRFTWPSKAEQPSGDER